MIRVSRLHQFHDRGCHHIFAHREDATVHYRLGREDIFLSHLQDEVAHIVIGGMHREMVRLVDLHDLAIPHNRHPVRKHQRLIGVVRDENDRLVHSLVQVFELLLQGAPPDRIDLAERLIHEQYGSVHRHGACDSDSLLHATAQSARI